MVGMVGYVWPAAMETGTVYVNGSVFDGELGQAVAAAGAGGLVEIEGTVYSRPVGLDFGSAPNTYEVGGVQTVVRLADVTIAGRGTNARIVLQPGYSDARDGSDDLKEDLLTVRGDHVTVRNLTLDAKLGVDFPLRVFGNHFMAEDVICKGGQRGAVNILSNYSGTVRSFIRVGALDSLQGGFYFDESPDCSGLTFTDCYTDGNVRVGVLVRNGYGDVGKLDLSGIQCRENRWAIEDRKGGVMNVTTPRWGTIEIVGLPTDRNAEQIATDVSLYYPMESAYKHIQFGTAALWPAVLCSAIATDRYGFNTEIHYAAAFYAADDLREGETITGFGFAPVLFLMQFLEMGLRFLPPVFRELFCT
jgi:hypothetical protein